MTRSSPAVDEKILRALKMPGFMERFWKKVSVGPSCWEWTAAKSHGYGRIKLPKPDKTAFAHRIAYMWLDHRPLGERLIRHTCDNPACVNPAHLEAGWAKDNTRDMLERGRCIVGSQASWSKLTEEDVREIKRLRGKLSQPKIAERFGVSRSAILHIFTGKNWGHVDA